MGYRTDLRAALKTALMTFAAANTGTLRGVYSARPGEIHETPAAWVDSINTTFSFFNGIRQQHFLATVTLADVVPDGAEAEARMDTLADALLETFSAAHLVDGYSITAPLGYTERLIEDGAVVYLGLDYGISLELGQGRP